MVARSHTPKGQVARRRIVDAAERLFAARGFRGTSVRDVADAVRVPLATVVYHFAKKERLYAAVLTEIAAELHAAVDVALAPAPGATWPERIDALSRALVCWSSASPSRVRLLVRELLDNPSRVARASQLPLAPPLARMAELLLEGAKARALRPGTPEVAVLHFVGAISYFVAARPTVERIVGPARAAAIAQSYEREALDLGRRAFGLVTEEDHGSRNAGMVRRASPRAHRTADDRRGGATRDAAGRRVPRRGTPRA